MYKKILSILIVISVAGALFGANDSETNQTAMQLVSFDVNHSTLQVATPDYSIGTISYASGEYDYLITDLEGQIRLIGAPDLPSTSTHLAVPAQGDINVDYSYTNIRVETDVRIAPFQPVQLEAQASNSGFIEEREIYESDKWFPESPVTLHDRVTMRDITMATLEVIHFQYNPQRKELRIYEGLEVNVTHAEPLLPPERPISRFFEPLYQNLIPNSTLVLEPNYQIPSILFIHPNNATVQLILQNLVDWKHEKGFETHTASTAVTGNSNSSIKSYIQQAYNTWDNPPEFVVLVGDAGGSFNIPTWTEGWSGYSGEGDHPYVHLDGGDYVSDAFVGRLTFGATSTLSNIVAKILNYEKNPSMADPTWFTRALLVGDQSNSGISTMMTNRNINEYMEHVGYQDNFQVYGGSFVSQMANGINAGVSYFNYRGYLGMSGWGDSNTSNLSNGAELPFVTILTCGTGNFQGNSKAEKFLKVGTSTVPKGGIGAVGTATSGTHTLYNNCVSVGIYHGIFSDQLYYAGAAVERGRLNLNTTYPLNPGNYVQVFSHWNNLMGDPSTELWTGVPQLLAVNMPDEIPENTQYLNLQVVDAIDMGVDDVWVSVTGPDVFETGYTDEDGMVSLHLPEGLPGSLTVTVSKHNYKPEQYNLSVSNDNYAVRIDGSELIETTGNGDNLANPGETVLLEWSFTNYSDEPANNVSINVLGEDGSHIDLFYETLDPGESVTLNGQYFNIPVDFPAIGVFDIGIEIDVDGVGYIDHRRFEIFAPYLHIDVIGETGAPPYSFDPGEISDLVLYCENVGNVGSSNLSAILRCNDPNITIEDSTATFSDAAPGEDCDNSASSFQVNINTQVTVGIQIPFQVEFTDDNGFVERKALLVPIGTPDVGDPTGPDAGGYFLYSDQDLAYALAPEYDWIEIVPALGGSGTVVPLNDNGNNQEDIHTVSLPFDFGFYGIDYNEISVSSNGYISVGPSEVSLFRNYPIPGPMGPNPMIAPFWDDLVMGSGDVYTYFNSAQHFFVVEYHDLRGAWSNSIQKFEIILYDPDYWGSEDGNGDIKIQYHTYNNDNSTGVGWASHGQYSTTGIEDHTGQVGIQYTFNNTWAETAHELTDESAIFFTTRTDAILPCPGWARGDVNHDGSRNVQDLILLVSALLGEITVGECEFWAADVTLDDDLDVGDIVLLVDVILGDDMARPSSTGPGEADLIIDGNSVTLKSSMPMEAFSFTVNSESRPSLVTHQGLTVTTSDNGNQYKVVGYWTNQGANEVELLRFPDADFNLTDPKVADGQGVLMKTGIVEIPETFKVNAVYPNPFNPTVNISFSLPRADEVSIQIYNALGQEVSSTRNQLQAGGHLYTWNGLNQNDLQVSSGIYFARISATDVDQMVKLTLLR